MLSKFTERLLNNKMKKNLYILFILIWSSMNAQVSEIPFEMFGSHIAIQINVNDVKEKAWFIFDTGAPTSILDETYAKKIRLESNSQKSLGGVSGGRSNYSMVKNQQITIRGSIDINNINLVISDLSRLSIDLKKDVVGIIGYDILKNYRVAIDFDTNIISFTNFNEDLLAEGYDSIDFEFGNGIPIPQFNISFELKNGEIFKGRIFFDTGAGLALMLNTPFISKHGITKKITKNSEFKGDGFSGKMSIQQTQIKTLTIGEFTFKELPVSLPSINQGVGAMPGYLGILGNDVIKRFNLIIDYKKMKLYLKPNQHKNDEFKMFPGKK